MMKYGKIMAGDVAVGYRVGRTKKEIQRVTQTSHGETSIWLWFEDGTRIRPRKTLVLWHEPDE